MDSADWVLEFGVMLFGFEMFAWKTAKVASGGKIGCIF
jgi:hypothetical protein